MAYIHGGAVKPKRSIWRLSIITDAFWIVFFYVRVFWKTLVSIDDSNAYKTGSDRRRPGGYGGGGVAGAGGGGGGGGGWGGSGGPPPGAPGTGSTPKRFSDMSGIRGADHNATCGLIYCCC